MKPSSLSPRLRSRSLLLMDSIPGYVDFLVAFATYSCSDSVGPRTARFKRDANLELQAALASGFGQRLDAAVVAVARAVESDLLDASGQGALGNHLADAGSGIGVLAVLQAFAHVGLHGGGRSQHLGAVGGEYLGVDVLAGAEHREPGHAEVADMRTGGLGAAQASDVLVHGLLPRGTRRP